MKIATHYNVAHIAVNRLRNSMADRLKYGLRAKCFCIGAVLPDMSPNLLIHRHFYALSGRYIEKKIKKMAKKGRSGCLQALRAGSIAHFLSDFCCSAHATGGIGNVKDHVLYELKMQRYVKAKREIFSGGHAQPEKSPDLSDKIFGLVNDYHTLNEHNCEVDIRVSVQVCEQLYAHLFKREEAKLLPLPTPAYKFDWELDLEPDWA